MNRIFKNICTVATSACVLAFCAVNLTACDMLFLVQESDVDVNGIPYTPFDTKAYSSEDIIEYIESAINQGIYTCNIFVRDENLVDTDTWLTSISGVEQLQCQYRKVKDGFNLVITCECWDNYPIMLAYHSGDTSALNERQLTLYNKYLEVLEEVTSPDASDYSNELAIHDYLVTNVSYVEKKDTSYNAYNAMLLGEAVCSGYTECFKTFMDMLGIENYTLSGVANNQQHIWNVVKLGSDYYHVDVTWDDPVSSTSEYINHEYFNVTDSDLKQDHTWDSAQNNGASINGTEFSYAYQAGLEIISEQAKLNTYIKSVLLSKKDHIEFVATVPIDLRSAVSIGNLQLKYSYKTVERSVGTIYSVIFYY